MKKYMSVYSLFIVAIFSINAGRQNGKIIFDKIVVVNDTQQEIIIDDKHTCQVGEAFIIENNVWLKEQTQKLVDIYLPVEKQSLKYPYLTYGLNAGKAHEIFSPAEVKISDLLKEQLLEK